MGTNVPIERPEAFPARPAGRAAVRFQRTQSGEAALRRAERGAGGAPVPSDATSVPPTITEASGPLARHVRHWTRRMCMVRSVRWGLRAVLFGVAQGCALALIARLRPWLLPEQVAQTAGVLALALLLGALVAAWSWPPRGLLPRARHFDRRFGLAERVSTALELSQRGVLPPEVGARQLADARRAAEQINVRALLPLRVHKAELAALLGLSALFAGLLLLPNPQANALRAERAWQQTLDAQVAALDAQIEAIEADDALSETAQQALTAPLQQAADTLAQESITPQEALSALTEAQQAVQELGDGVSPDAQQAYQDAAQALANTEASTSLAQALQESDLSAAADALDTLAQDAGDGTLSEAEREQLAEELGAAADALEAQNPALAQQFREAADALREDDPDAAQQALQQASALAEQQDAALQQSAQAQQAQAAAQTLQESAQALTQNGQTPQETVMQGEQEGGAHQGESSSAAQQDAANAPEQQAQPAGQPPSEAESAGAGAPQAGGGEGDAGQEGATASEAGSAQDNNAPTSAEDTMQDYSPQNPSTALGGEGDQTMTLETESETTEDDANAVTVGVPDAGAENTIGYSGVLRHYQQAVNDALNNGRIPLDQRDAIHDYFTSLNQQP